MYKYLGFTRFYKNSLIFFEIFFYNVIDNHEKSIQIKINPEKWRDLLQVLNKYIPWLNFK